MPWTQKQMLRDANGDLIPQYWDVVEQEFKPLTGRDGANDVRLTGSIVEEVTIFNGLAISDLSEYASEYVDVSKYSKVFYVAYTTLDVPVELDIRIDGGTTTRFWDGSAWKQERWEIPNSHLTNRFLLNQRAPILNDIVATRVRWYLKAKGETPPTRGSITLLGYGVK